jgi:organic radical activating enzyme
MKKIEVFRAWGNILAGLPPSLSIEITKECPLQCPGCYAFDPAHLGGSTQLRQLSDFKGDELVRKVLAVIDEYRPLHVSLVGGDPLVRYRELELLLPQIERRGVHTQVVTSAFRVVPSTWKSFKKLNVVVSIDGLQPEHDERRKPATYERILKNIADAKVTVHCTVTSQIAERPGYLERVPWLSGVPESGDCEGLVQPLHATERRNRSGDSFSRAAPCRDERTAPPSPNLSEARHARHRH